MNKLLYISTGVPEAEVNRLREKQVDFESNSLLPISVFHGNMLSGLAESYDEVEALSGVPISRRNYNIARYETKKIKCGKILYHIPGFINYPGIKQLTVILKIWWNIIKWYRKNKDHHCSIIIDGAFYTGLISLALASGFVKAQVGAILVDNYPFMDPSEKTLSQKVYYKLLKKVDRFAFVTEYLQQRINRDGKPYIIVEGLVNGVHAAEAPEAVEDYCVYAGGLYRIYGVDKLVDAFHEMQVPYSLHLYGNGDVIDYIQEVSKTDPRIEYKGLLSHDQLLQVERSAKLLINPRPVHGELDTRFNFPSKLMEYMQSGRPVITTKLLGIPEEYNGKMFFFEDDTKPMLKEGLEKVLKMDEAYLASFGEAAKRYVDENKNNRAVGKKIFSLMNAEEND